MKRFTVWILVVVLIAAFLPAGAAAQTMQAPKPGALRKADTDQDGKLTATEFQTAFPKHGLQVFQRLDRNDDGVLDAKDKAGRALPDMFRRADSDKDGRVSYAELKQTAPDLTPERFERLDKNGDGFLSAADRGAEANTKTVKKEGDREQALWLMYRKADSNGDGETTYPELIAAKPGFPRDNFDAHDTNKDGVISEADRG